jgi:hypothetical protein
MTLVVDRHVHRLRIVAMSTGQPKQPFPEFIRPAVDLGGCDHQVRPL